MFGAMGNLCCNLLIVDLCLNFGVLQKLASHQSPSLFEMAIVGLDCISNPDSINAHILLIFICRRGCVVRHHIDVQPSLTQI
jgi:hypothetical protein